MNSQDWFDKNRTTILKKLHWLVAKPQGLIYEKRTALHDIAILKAGNQIRLIYEDPTTQEIMSRIDITAPLNLLAIYTQATMLSLIWQSEPSRVYVVGFGGGRIPMILHHYFPNVRIESADIEPAIAEIAEKYFGITFDDRMRLSIKDGRDYLITRHRRASVRYDLITLDGFRGIGYGPYRLSTLDFYHLCISHLTEQGVVAANMLDGDQLYLDKIKTFFQAFPTTYLLKYEGANVLIGTISPQISKSEILQRAAITFHSLKIF